MNNEELSKSLSRFEGVYLSGFIMDSPALVTAASLVFERVHILNHLEYVIRFAKEFRYIHPPEDKELEGLRLLPMLPDDADGLGMAGPVEPYDADPLQELNAGQRKTALAYLAEAGRFCITYSDLFPSVFQSNLFPDSEILRAELIEERPGEQDNLYMVSVNPMQVSMGGGDELAHLLNEGCVPIIGMHDAPDMASDSTQLTPKHVAAILAMKSVEMVLPATRQASGEIILEARERLADQLPPFWSAMLRLSNFAREQLADCDSMEVAMQECQNVVDSTVRPALIDLVDKMKKERKRWFHHILSPVSHGLRVVAGRPPLSPADLVSASLMLGANVTLDVSQQLQKAPSAT